MDAPVAPLVISAVSAAFALVSAGAAWTTIVFSRRWRQEAERAAIVSFCVTLSTTQAFRDDELQDWSAGGVHESVYNIRSKLSDLIGHLPLGAIGPGGNVLVSCAKYLLDLRPFVRPTDRSMTDAEVMRRHQEWKSAVEKDLIDLSKLVDQTYNLICRGG